MISSIISRLIILVFGTLYPAYASYKAVRTKNVKEYVKWMMYWIVFALFTCAETFTDVFCSFWFPFYYEFKVILVLWLLSPATKGSSILYRKFVHPMLTKREQEIDEYIAKAKEQGYHTVLTLGSKGVNYATTVIMQTAIKGGGGLVNQLRRSYSLSDISADMEALAEMNRINALPEDELDLGDMPMPIDPRIRRSRGYSPRRSASGSGRVEMYFPEVDVNVRQRGTRPRETGIPLSHIRSNEDVSSGYSSAEMLYSGQPPPTEAQEPLVRTSSVGSSRVTRTKVATRGGAVTKRPTPAEDNLSWSESDDSDCGNQEEYFYDVPSAPPSEPVVTPPCATLSQPLTSLPTTGGDFKSHLPVALVSEPQGPESTADIQHSTSNFNQSEGTSVQCQEIEKVESSVQGLHAETHDTVELPTPYSESVLPALVDKEGHSCESETSVKDVVSFSDTDNEAQAIDSIPTTVESGELKIDENLVTNIPAEHDESEFFDTENDLPQRSIALAEASNIPDVILESTPHSVDEIQNNKNLAENKNEKAIDELLKDGRAGRYHKHQAPCPPPKSCTESLELASQEDGGNMNATSDISDRTSPSPRRESSVSKNLQASPNVNKRNILADDRNSPSPRREISIPNSPQPSPNVCKKNERDDIIGGNPNVSVKHVHQSMDKFQGDTSTHHSAIPVHVERLDVKPSGSDSAKSKVVSSPNPKRKESKTKQDTTIMSRLLSKPKNHLASFFPFLSTRDESRPISDLLTTSLISLDVDSRAQDRARSSSIVGTAQSRSEYMSVPPELPPRRRTPDTSGASKDENSGERGTRMNIREMSHSPPRRHAY